MSAFGRTPTPDQAKFCLDINHEAKPVEPNLIWDFVGTLSPNEIPDGVISTAVKRLQNTSGFFCNRIKIPSMPFRDDLDVGKEAKFNLNNICTSLKKDDFGEKVWPCPYSIKPVKNPFYKDQPDAFSRDLTKALKLFFKGFDDGLRPRVRENIYSDGFVSVLISILKSLSVYSRVVLGRKPNGPILEELVEPIQEFLNHKTRASLIQMRKNLSSEAGKSDLKKSLESCLNNTFDDFTPLFMV